MIKIPKLKQHKKLYAYSDKRYYEFKDTECGRLFIWKPKYHKDSVKLNPPSLDYKDYDTDEEWHKAWDKMKSTRTKNREMGTCFELKKCSLKSFIEREQDTIDFFKECKRKGHKGSSNGRSQYEGDIEENAKKEYDHKNNYDPYGWGGIMGSYSQHWMIELAQKNSDRVCDENGKEIFYDREFFDNIVFNSPKVVRELKKMKSFIEGCGHPEYMEIYERHKDCKDPAIIKRQTNVLKVELYFLDKRKEMDADIKKLIRGSGMKVSDMGYSYRIK